jgi:hypothetical protein
MAANRVAAFAESPIAIAPAMNPRRDAPRSVIPLRSLVVGFTRHSIHLDILTDTPQMRSAFIGATAIPSLETAVEKDKS